MSARELFEQKYSMYEVAGMKPLKRPSEILLKLEAPKGQLTKSTGPDDGFPA
jgi:hypothetical protein